MKCLLGGPQYGTCPALQLQWEISSMRFFRHEWGRISGARAGQSLSVAVLGFTEPFPVFQGYAACPQGQRQTYFRPPSREGSQTLSQLPGVDTCGPHLAYGDNLSLSPQLCFCRRCPGPGFLQTSKCTLQVPYPWRFPGATVGPPQSSKEGLLSY